MVVAAAAIAALALWWIEGRTVVSTDNAYVGGNIVPVSSLVEGVVIELGADETQRVEAGQTLVRLDDTDHRLRLAAAQAALGEAVRSVRALHANTGQMRATRAGREADLRRVRFELAAAEAAVERARSDLERREALAAQNFVSPESVQTARTALQATVAQRDAARAAVSQADTAISAASEQLRAASGLIDRLPIEGHPRVLEAAARVREAHLAVVRNEIAAPVSGYVARRQVQIGQRITPSTPLMTVIPADQLWVDANFKESQLRHVRIGQPVHLQSDLHGSSVVFRGRVAGMSMGTGGAFALLPAQNATGNWIKVLQRVPVRVTLDPAELAAHPLRIGLSMRASIDTSERAGDVLARLPPETPAMRAESRRSVTAEADAMIARIIGEHLDAARP